MNHSQTLRAALAAITSILLTQASCTDHGPTSNMAQHLQQQKLSDPELENTEWRLIELNGQPVNVGSTLKLAQGAAFGTTGCNRYHGSYTVQDDSLALSPMALSRRACPGIAGQVEQSMMRIFESRPNFDLGSSYLKLISPQGSLLFVPAEPAPSTEEQ